ncbi:glycoside hydrolase family 3 protein [Oceanispirochaeta crateris]|uniref:beta-N-acetylhexosaminidase n=1 Tax=Oceanispirochaeta crateris TaxID=2518645 RepID=A0A5C1QIR9_9SPIO|nr:glycoside hydrolase family 3 protein [Oceanispirochaeta crateris]QEN07198.1 glycoside hydrolase family 3 protein [Oceanispirochaeta crateris]
MALILKRSIFLTIFTSVVFPLLSLDFNSELPGEQLVEELLDHMSQEEILGQVFMLGYMGERASDVIMDWIVQKKIGGIKIFGWNANDLSILADTISTMQKGALSTEYKIPLIIATDQEGGWVRHIKGETSITPGNLALGASGIPYDSYMTGLYIGRELRRLGINMNFAPTVDVYLNPLADVIGPRAFSQNPVQTGTLGTAFFKGMEEAGIISTAKHFPGHGNADEDSHGTLPEIPSTLEFIESHDLIPYKMMIKEGLPAIMVGHLAFPNITGNLKPASLSSIFLKDILRDQLQYKGLVITDDLVMQGAQYENRSLPEVCEMALREGNDFLLVSRNPDTHEEIWQHLIGLMDEDEEFSQDVRTAAARVLRIKVDYLKREDHVPFFPSPSDISQDIPGSDSQKFFFGQAARSTTMIRQSLIPIEPTSNILFCGLHYDFRRMGEAMFDGRSIRVPYSFTTSEKWEIINSIREQASKMDYVVFSLSRYQDLRILKELEDLSHKMIVLSSLTPIYLNELPWVKDALAVYGTGIESFQAGLGAIRGDFIPSGTLPIDLIQNSPVP